VSEANPWLGSEISPALKGRKIPAPVQGANLLAACPGVRFAHPWLFSRRAFGAYWFRNLEYFSCLKNGKELCLQSIQLFLSR
jgi:hypothetical protein